MTGSLLTVESNHFCVLKSRGAIFNVYEGGQYPVQTTDRPIMGSIQQAFYSGQSPWQYEALFVSAAKSVAKARGSRAVARAGGAGLRRGLLRARRHQGRRGQARDPHALPGSLPHHRGAQRLRRAGASSRRSTSSSR